jgi:hypothetical protein
MTETPTSGTADKSSTSTCRDSTERRARVARRLSRQREKIKARGLHAQQLVARDTIAYEMNRRRKKHPGKQLRLIRELRALVASALGEMAAEREAASRTANRGRRRGDAGGKLNPNRGVAASRAWCRSHP